jgi:hypothetical protein
VHVKNEIGRIVDKMEEAFRSDSSLLFESCLNGIACGKSARLSSSSLMLATLEMARRVVNLLMRICKQIMEDCKYV